MAAPSTAIAKVDESASAVEQFMAEFGGAAPVGLENVGSEDISLAAIKIDHKEGVFVDSLTGQTYAEIDGVLLGMLKQRVLWDPDPEAKTGPLCKSSDSLVGEPREAFPWVEFKKQGGNEALGAAEINCGTCAFAKWGSHPKNKTPWCSMQYTFPLVIGLEPGVAGLVTFQRSGVKPTQAYMSGFVRDKIPLFAYRTKLSLNVQKAGTVDFATPVFKRGEAITDISQMREWAAAFKTIAEISGSADLGHDVLIEPVVPAGQATASPF